MPGSLEKSVSSAKERSRRIAQVLDDVITFLRSTAITRDFYTGYSLTEAIQERLDTIGGTGQEGTQAPSGRQTLLSELKVLEDAGLQAIAAAREMESLRKESDIDVDKDPVSIGNNTFIEGT